MGRGIPTCAGARRVHDAGNFPPQTRGVEREALLLWYPAQRARALLRCRLHPAERLLRGSGVRAREGQHDPRAFAEGPARGSAHRAHAPGGGSSRPLPFGDPVRDHARQPRSRLDRRAGRRAPGRPPRAVHPRPRAGQHPPLRGGRHRLRDPHLWSRALRRAGAEAHRHPALRGAGPRLRALPPHHLSRVQAAPLDPRGGDEADPAQHGDEQ